MRATRLGFWLASPALAFILMFLYFPAFYGFYYSLFDIRYLSPGEFVGLANYLDLFRDAELGAIIGRSAAFTFGAVSLAISIAMALAILMEKLRGPIAMAIQIIVMVPWIISVVVGALLFRWVYVSDLGLLVYLADLFNVRWIEPLSHPVSAMALLIVVAVWRTLGFAFVLLRSGLIAIPEELYEAARVDGANRWQAFWRITLPLLKTPLLVCLVVLSLSNLNNVENPLITTGGAPGGLTTVMPLELYLRAFAYYDFSSAISMAIGMFLANIVLVLIYVRLVKWNV